MDTRAILKCISRNLFFKLFLNCIFKWFSLIILNIALSNRSDDSSCSKLTIATITDEITIHQRTSCLNKRYFDGLMQERRNCSALAMELRLSYNNPSIWPLYPCNYVYHLNPCWNKIKPTVWMRPSRRSVHASNDMRFMMVSVQLYIDRPCICVCQGSICISHGNGIIVTLW